MEEAAKEEIRIAVEEGSVTPDGTPILTVIADGGWAKRSYRSNYNSLSGVAAIVGSHTKKVIFMGVRNKYCTICARADSSHYLLPSIPASRTGQAVHPAWKLTLFWRGSARVRRCMAVFMASLLRMVTQMCIINF
ncbi:uncharacterized protein LOC120355163 [Nilaparvata lugens]|uniref:uncharacterized protein LOC120355163 n=1 Tax=Nilaparvata lugens TaxID=108931 RepID=UPI00193E0058|nr:uncharacterized protein LOC120355163 [Nilaparvata lugens]